MIGSHSCIKISQYVQLFCFGNVANSNIQFLVELILGVCSGAQGWCNMYVWISTIDGVRSYIYSVCCGVKRIKKLSDPRCVEYRCHE